MATVVTVTITKQLQVPVADGIDPLRDIDAIVQKTSEQKPTIEVVINEEAGE